MLLTNDIANLTLGASICLEGRWGTVETGGLCYEAVPVDFGPSSGTAMGFLASADESAWDNAFIAARDFTTTNPVTPTWGSRVMVSGEN